MKKAIIKSGTTFIVIMMLSSSLKAQLDYSFTYDDSGNRTELNVLTLKSAEISDVSSDSSYYNPPGDSAKIFTAKTGETEIKIFPNPTSGSLRIEISSTASIDKGKILIYNSNGMRVLLKENLQQSNVIDLSGQQTGIYYMKIYLNKLDLSEWKIIKQ
jgi:hypothetical protein